MREILVLTPDFPPERGGIQVLVYRVVSSWQRTCPRVVTLASAGGPAFDRELPYRVHRIGSVRTAHRLRLLALNAAALAIGLRRRPAVVVSGHIVTSPAAWLLSRALRIPFVQYLHGQEIAVRPALASFAVRHATCSIAVSRHTRDLVLRHGADPGRVRLIHPGVDAVEIGDKEARRPDIVVVARLEERYKGHDVLIRALPLVRVRVPQARLLVVGDGALRVFYERLARSLSIEDAIVFAGAVDDTERDLLLAEASVFAMPSRRLPDGAGEGFGIVFLEAAVRGLPVVAGAAGGSIDAVVDGETGLLVDPTDHVAVADALVEILTRPQLAQRLAENGARRAAAFAWPRVSADVESVLLELASAR